MKGAVCINNWTRCIFTCGHLFDQVLASLTSNAFQRKLHTVKEIESKLTAGKAMEAAVVSASCGVMASLLGKLADLLTDKYKLIKEAKGQIMFLKAELETMYVFLQKMSDTEEPDVQAKCWANDVRELSYDIEDSINEFTLRLECESSSKPQGFRGFINRSITLLTTMNIRHGIAKELEGFKSRVMEVSERYKRYKIDDTTVSMANNTSIDRRLLALYAESSGLVGIDGPREQLIQLMDEQGTPANQLKVLSIVGFGGLGKTTLANEIYRKLEGQFQCRALVSVSQKPNMRKILRSMLLQAGFVAPEHTDVEIWDELELIAALRKFLFEKRYFVVIDDIWDASAWDIIRCALPENRKGSRIITTTRIETVARECCSYRNEYVYKMKPLSGQDSKSLFYKRVFGSEDACPPYLKEVSSEILKKCGGLPLAIITISSLLANQPKKLKKHWEYVRNSLRTNFEVNPSLEGMREILNLSYINLPRYLKTCMLYLCIYPEDYTINRNDLARQWVAEGFISKSHGADPEDVAKSYFNELINRSMIQPINNADYNGEVMFCRVHDIMLDLILEKSREENFITVVDGIKDMTGHHNKIRRLSVHLMDGPTENHTTVSSAQLSQIRTLAIFGISKCFPPFLLFKHLRVLKVEISKKSQSALLDLTGICHLIQLRYLKIIANSHGVVLPSKIGSLQQLEMFQLETRSSSSSELSLCQLPTDIVHVSPLLHLIAPKWTGLPDGIGKLKSLRTLRNFELGMSSGDSIKGLRELTNLTDLKIRCNFVSNLSSTPSDEVVEAGREVLQACLEKMCNLKYLHIDSDGGEMDVSISVPASSCQLQRFRAPGFLRVPKWIGQLHNLYDLKLIVKEVLEDDIEILSQLPSLTYLVLIFKEAPEHKIVIRENGFLVLKHLKVVCNKISFLTFEAGAMTKLEGLKLCFNAHGWDRHGAALAGMEYLSGLKVIFVDIGGRHAKESNIRAARSALRNAIDMHPGRPAAKIKCHDDETFGFDEVDEECDDSCC
ncbi:hypothetical protein PR202_ga11772 [Eleusine coracana subsp. coracana]|uniref:Uncharacterized protein n=1 Tax=Eleusine coracana subsp. coracana TaxID=191504 RepID=A0AAV5CAF5_ELECO|nr:hypothetical protein PR202_ga11772 [Eleusine coracana subsp. coracana]